MIGQCRWCGGPIGAERRSRGGALYCSRACCERAKSRRRVRPRGVERCICIECGVDYIVDWTGKRGRPPECCSRACKLARTRRFNAEAKRRAERRRPAPAITHAPCEEQPTCATCRHALDGGVCALYIATYYRALALGEIGDLMGVTRERVRQIEEKALEKLSRRAPEALRELLEQDSDDWHRRPGREEVWRLSERYLPEDFQAPDPGRGPRWRRRAA